MRHPILEGWFLKIYPYPLALMNFDMQVKPTR